MATARPPSVRQQRVTLFLSGGQSTATLDQEAIVAYALEENEPLSAAIKRIAVEQIDLALAHLGAAPENVSESLHATRQCLKRLRAVLLLVRQELGDKVFEREWSCYREAGRLLAGARDAEVVVETLDALINHFSYQLSGNAFASERRFLAGRRDASLKLMIEERATLENVSEMLVSSRARIATWPTDGSGFDALRKGLRRSYRAGRRGLRTAISHRSPTHFHAWRKPVKLLWHQVQILIRIWPVMMQAHADELHALSDRLNANHDLDVLRRAAVESALETQAQDCEALSSLIEGRCRELEAEALLLGKRLYTERAGEFTARLESFWKTWRDEAPEHGAVSDPRNEMAFH